MRLAVLAFFPLLFACGASIRTYDAYVTAQPSPSARSQAGFPLCFPHPESESLIEAARLAALTEICKDVARQKGHRVSSDSSGKCNQVTLTWHAEGTGVSSQTDCHDMPMGQECDSSVRIHYEKALVMTVDDPDGKRLYELQSSVAGSSNRVTDLDAEVTCRAAFTDFLTPRDAQPYAVEVKLD